MSTMPIEAQHNRWGTLQNRSCSPDPDEDTFYALLAALDAGWWIEPPVYARSRWGSEHTGKQMYHFDLRRDTRTTMISEADGSRVRTFMQE